MSISRKLQRSFQCLWLHLRASGIIPLLLLMLPTAGQAGLTFVTNNSTITITGYTGPGGAVNIPGTINGLPVTSIANGAFVNLETMTSVSIPNSVTGLGSAAFENCSGLTSITIPNSVTNLGGSTFTQCSSLTNVSIGNGVNSL